MFERALGLCAPEPISRHFDDAETVAFGACRVHAVLRSGLFAAVRCPVTGDAP